MTNEELIQAIYLHPEDTAVMQHLMNNLEGFIRSIAKKIAAAFNCLEYDEIGTLTTYSQSIIDDLTGEGTIELLEVISAQKYDADKGALTTYLYPNISGRMRRWMERNTGGIALSKHAMGLVRKLQRMYHAEGLSAADIAAQTGLSEMKVARLLNYNTHSISLDELLESESSLPDTLAYDTAETVEDRLIAKHRYADMEQAFSRLSERDRYILGHFFGIFGYDKKTLDDLAFEEMMTVDGVFKAKEKALKRLRDGCGMFT